MSDISFENYKPTERDHYRRIRNGTSDVSFSYLFNYVVADMDDRVLAVEVDDHFAEMCGKLDDYENSEDWVHHYLPHAGKVVVNPIGEQIIAFCETDFKEHMKLPLLLLDMREGVRADAPESEALRKEFGFVNKTLPVVEKPTSDAELNLVIYENYEYLGSVAENFIKSNLYVNIYPPLIFKWSKKMLKAYFTYILALQGEYRKLLDFCFNMDFYKEELDGITAASRFSLYCQTTDAVPVRALEMSFRFTRSVFGSSTVNIRDKQAYEDFRKNPAAKLNEVMRAPNAFERKYDISCVSTELARLMPVPIFSSYSCRSLEEMLFLEFEKMLELDMQIKKCKNCGRYFILKGNYQTEYCGRVPEGESQNCQMLGATAKYAQKVKDSPALALFNRAYKRYHARVKAGSVKPDAFKKWKYEAVVMRDKCLDGEMAMDEFERWINGYFG